MPSSNKGRDTLNVYVEVFVVTVFTSFGSTVSIWLFPEFPDISMILGSGISAILGLLAARRAFKSALPVVTALRKLGRIILIALSALSMILLVLFTLVYLDLILVILRVMVVLLVVGAFLGLNYIADLIQRRETDRAEAEYQARKLYESQLAQQRLREQQEEKDRLVRFNTRYNRLSVGEKWEVWEAERAAQKEKKLA